MKIYLAGPMTGKFGFNALAFKNYERTLQTPWIGGPLFGTKHIEIVNPAELDRALGITPCPYGRTPEGMTLKDFMKRDLPALMECDGIFLLPGYARSRGAMCELDVANACGLSTYHWMELHDMLNWPI